jgi:transposase InsO family protein
MNKLQPASSRLWGKMDAAQMMAHCSAGLDMASGRLNLPRAFIGRVLGPFFKSVFTNDKPFGRNAPTDPKLVVSDSRDFERERELLKQKVRIFHEGGEAKCTRHPHPFFGDLTPTAWGRGMYKHLDHHLRQFGG